MARVLKGSHVYLLLQYFSHAVSKDIIQVGNVQVILQQIHSGIYVPNFIKIA